MELIFLLPSRLANLTPTRPREIEKKKWKGKNITVRFDKKFIIDRKGRENTHKHTHVRKKADETACRLVGVCWQWAESGKWRDVNARGGKEKKTN